MTSDSSADHADPITARLARARRMALLELDLSDHNISLLPISIGDLHKLQHLGIHHNHLARLPAAIGNLSRLRVLEAAYNRLLSIPPDVGKLYLLQHLSLSNNRLRAVPASIGRLRNLRYLSLSQNRISHLPDTVGRLGHLQRLSLAGNDLNSLPNSFCRLAELEWLDVSENHLMSMPPAIGDCVNLRMMDFSRNNLRSLPPSIANLHQLRELYLHDNDDLGIPPEVLGPSRDDVSQGANAARPADILRFYFQSRRESARQLNEAKVLVVGQGDVGKTSLVKRLVFNTFDAREAQTEGINIVGWKIPKAGLPNEHVKLNIWDFGGQEIMHATHQFFLTKRSVYLIVVDARKGETESNLIYWLSIIKSYGGDSPIIVVVNKSEPPHNLDLNETRLAKDYAPNLRSFVKVSAKTGEGFDKLNSMIVNHISNLRHLGDVLPESYFKVKETLAKKKKDFIDYREYERLCKKFGVTDRDGQGTLIRFLHDLGDVLYFHDEDSPYDELKDTNILNPEWVTKGVYKILNNLELVHQHGVLEKSRLEAILNDHKHYPPDKHDFLIGMMRKFELCFDFPDCNGQRILIPELLHPNEPELGYNIGEAFNFEYHYNVLPQGLISRFIVRMHHRLTQKPTYWRSGVVLEIDGNQALVRADIQKGRIYVAIFGPMLTRARALAPIRDAFSYIHRTVPQLLFEERVPLPDNALITVGYTHLHKLVDLGEDTVFPDGAERKYSVRELLEGVQMVSGFDVFLSHNSSDKPIVRELGENLRSRGLSVWLDEWELVPGRPWQEALEEIIKSVNAAAVLVGSDGLGPWEVPEMRGCLSEFVRRKLPVIPVLLPGAPRKPELPMFLSQFTWVDLRGGLTDSGLSRLEWGITGRKPTN